MVSRPIPENTATLTTTISPSGVSITCDPFSGILYALSIFDGEVIWTHTDPPCYGAPAVSTEQDEVIFTDSVNLASVSLQTGTTQWESPFNVRDSFLPIPGLPLQHVLPLPFNTSLLLVATLLGVFQYDVATHQLTWPFYLPENWYLPDAPLLVGDFAILALVINPGDPTNSGGGLVSINAKSGSLAWVTLSASQYQKPPVLSDDTLYVFGSVPYDLYTPAQHLVLAEARDVFTGNLFWQVELPGIVTTNPVMYENLVVAVVEGNSRETIIALERATGELVWESVPVRPCYPANFVADGILYLSMHRNIAALNVTTGKLLHRVVAPAEVKQLLVHSGSLVAVNMADSFILAIDTVLCQSCCYFQLASSKTFGPFSDCIQAMVFSSSLSSDVKVTLNPLSNLKSLHVFPVENNYLSSIHFGFLCSVPTLNTVYIHVKEIGELLSVDPDQCLPNLFWSETDAADLQVVIDSVIISRVEPGALAPAERLRRLSITQVDLATIENILHPYERSPTWTYSNGASTGALCIVGDILVASAGRSIITGLNKHSGKLLWETQIHESLPDYAMGRALTTHGELVYVATLLGKVIAVNAVTGSIVWEFTVPAKSGVYHSPSIFEGVLYLATTRFSLENLFYPELENEYNAFINSNTSRLAIAIDALTGDALWEVETGFRVFSAPLVTEQMVYIPAYDGYVVAYDRQTGAEIWTTFLGGVVSATPCLLGHRLFVGAFVRDPASGDPVNGTVISLSATTGEILWVSDTFGAFQSNPVCLRDTNRVLLGSEDSALRSFNASTGEEVWVYDSGAPIRHTTPLLHEGSVYVGSTDGALHSVSEEGGGFRWKFSAGKSEIYTDIILNELTLYFVGLQGITAVSLPGYWQQDIALIFPLLERLDLNDVGLASTTSPPCAFKHSHLTYLEVTNNELTTISPSIFWCLPAVTTLDVSDNMLEEFDLSFLYLLDNDDFQLLHTASTLSLLQGDCTRIAKTKRLVLRNTGIHSIHPMAFCGTPEIRSLDLSFNPLTEVTLKNLPLLQQLSLSHCSLASPTALILQGMVNLQSLDISHNFLTLLPDNLFEDALVINTVDFSNNYLQIQRLPKANLLTFANLSRNELTHIPNGLFNATPLLAHVDLSFNPIEILSSAPFHSHATNSLWLQGTPLRRIEGRARRVLQSIQFVDFGEFNSNPLTTIHNCDSSTQGYCLGRMSLQNKPFCTEIAETEMCTSGLGNDPCPAGSWCSNGTATECGWNMYSVEGSTACTPCGEGFYAPPGSTACTSCGFGEVPIFDDLFKAVRCSVCPAGTRPLLGQCQPCPIGHRCNGVSAEPCEQGSYAPAPGAALCHLCPSGTYGLPGPLNRSAELLACAPCGPGTFTDTEGALLCQLCPNGTYANMMGAMNDSECINCDDQEYCPAGSSLPLHRNDSPLKPLIFNAATVNSLPPTSPASTAMEGEPIPPNLQESDLDVAYEVTLAGIIGSVSAFVILHLFSCWCTSFRGFIARFDMFSLAHPLKPLDYRQNRPTYFGGITSVSMLIFVACFLASSVYEYYAWNTLVSSSMAPTVEIGLIATPQLSLSASAYFLQDAASSSSCLGDQLHSGLHGTHRFQQLTEERYRVCNWDFMCFNCSIPPSVDATLTLPIDVVSVSWTWKSETSTKQLNTVRGSAMFRDRGIHNRLNISIEGLPDAMWNYHESYNRSGLKLFPTSETFASFSAFSITPQERITVGWNIKRSPVGQLTIIHSRLTVLQLFAGLLATYVGVKSLFELGISFLRGAKAKLCHCGHAKKRKQSAASKALQSTGSIKSVNPASRGNIETQKKNNPVTRPSVASSAVVPINANTGPEEPDDQVLSVQLGKGKWAEQRSPTIT